MAAFFSQYAHMNHDELYKKTGLNLKTRRQELGIRQADVAKLAGISRPSLANIEAGKQAMTLHLFYRISSVLNIGNAKELLPAGVITPRKVDLEHSLEIDPERISRLNDDQIALVQQVLGKSTGKK